MIQNFRNLSFKSKLTKDKISQTAVIGHEKNISKHTMAVGGPDQTVSLSNQQLEDQISFAHLYETGTRNVHHNIFCFFGLGHTKLLVPKTKLLVHAKKAGSS